jgi:hypothetical protein
MKKVEDDIRLGVNGAVGHCDAEFDAPIFVNGVRAIKSTLNCDVRPVSREVSLATLVAYADPLDSNHGTKALVGSLDLASSEIVEASDNVSLVVDLSRIEIPANCLFHIIHYDFGRIVEIRGVKFIGLQDAMAFQNTIQFRFEGA